MSWGLEISDVFVSHASLEMLDEDIEEAKNEILYCTTVLTGYTTTAPYPVFDCEGRPMDWVEYVTDKVAGLVTRISEAAAKLKLLTTCKNFPEKVRESI